MNFSFKVSKQVWFKNGALPIDKYEVVIFKERSLSESPVQLGLVVSFAREITLYIQCVLTKLQVMI